MNVPLPSLPDRIDRAALPGQGSRALPPGGARARRFLLSTVRGLLSLPAAALLRLIQLYQLTLSPTATYEWRAYFTKPSDEGVRASSSSSGSSSVMVRSVYWFRPRRTIRRTSRSASAERNSRAAYRGCSRSCPAAARKRVLEAVCPACFNRLSIRRARDLSNMTMASAQLAMAHMLYTSG